ncbi:MAG: hypothetical protein ACO3GX_08985 [Gemmataceae bacterium]
MGLNIGKKMVHLVALGSFFIATWGFALYSNPVLTPAKDAFGKVREGSWQEIEDRKAKIDSWFKQKGDDPTPIQGAAERYHRERSRISDMEAQLPVNQKYFKDELEFLKTKATEKDPALQLKLVGGQSIRTGNTMVPLVKEPVKDIDGLDMPSLEALGKKVDELSKQMQEMQKNLTELSKESKMLVDKQANTKDANGVVLKGLQDKIEDEKKKRLLIEQEFDAIQQALVNVTLETDDLYQRKAQLEKRIVELRNVGLTTVP